jgi:glycosyltransferase involved in cell wall biosynthesis
MHNPISPIIRAATRKQDEPLNILTYSSHERFEPNLALTGHNFFSLITDGTRTWNEKYSPVPQNYHIFRDTLPDYFLNQIDLIISHNPYVHIPLALNLNLGVPIINIFHTMPSPGWNNINIHPQAQHLFDQCTEHVYISEFNKAAWGYNRGRVIHHGLDTNLFKPPQMSGWSEFGPSIGCAYDDKPREPRVLTVANDYINRDWALGFSIWKHLSNDFPMFPVGTTPGLSQPAKNMDELIQIYNTSRIFLNTSTASPIPMSLLEAMSCGCACVSAATCMIPEIIEHGVDGYLCPVNKPEKFKEYLNLLLTNPDHAAELGRNARLKIQHMFSLDKFVENWNNTFGEILNGK